MCFCVCLIFFILIQYKYKYSLLSLVKFSNRRWQLALVKSQTRVSVRDSRRTLFERTRIYRVNKSPRSGDRECRVIEHRSFPFSLSRTIDFASLYAVRRFVSNAIPARPPSSSSSTLLLFPRSFPARSFFPPSRTVYRVIIIHKSAGGRP